MRRHVLIWSVHVGRWTDPDAEAQDGIFPAQNGDLSAFLAVGKINVFFYLVLGLLNGGRAFRPNEAAQLIHLGDYDWHRARALGFIVGHSDLVQFQ